MLDEKDLQAISQLIDTKLEAQTQALDTKLETQTQTFDAKLGTMAQSFDAKLNLLIENVFEPRFSLLAENQQLMMEKLERLDDIEIMDTRITALEAMVKKLNRDVAQLKKAN